jgi:predicted DNA-binding protein (UPF0251 family)/DNA-directed RNA polymerase subunit RPC12/RpoP
MGRRSQKRFIKIPPDNFYFKSTGDTSSKSLTLAEFEAMRLKHYHNLPQEKAAAMMGVSQPTFSRILDSAHAKVTNALIEGREIRIYGGNVDYKDTFIGYGCLNCNNEWKDNLATRDRKMICPKCNSQNTYYLVKEPL